MATAKDTIGVRRLVLFYIGERHEANELAPTTIRSFREALLLFAKEVGESRQLATVTRRELEEWMRTQAKRGNGPATIRLRMSTVRGLYRWAVDNGFVKVDPTLNIKMPKPPRHLPRALRPEQVGAALAGALDERERLMILLMCQEGLRAVEVSRLNFDDVDMASRSMLVRGKGGYERLLPITDESWAALEGYLSRFPVRHGPLIRSYSRPLERLQAPYVASRVSNALHRAGVRESGHALRHTAATQMLKHGAGLRDVQTMLGHQSLQNTQRYLAFTAVGELRDLMGSVNYGRSVDV
jgi:site-specific recombinase XerD